MNRILLASSLAVSAAIIAAHEKGISKSEIFHLANSLDQLDKGRNLIATPFKIGQKLIAAKVSAVDRYQIASSKVTRGQISYCIAKHLKEKVTSQKKNNKSKVPRKGSKGKVTIKSRTVISTSAADIQKRIKFSAPLKVITANVVSSC